MSCSEFSLKESSGLLSIVQLSKFFVLSFATALIDYHIFRRLSTTFLFLLFQRCVLARNSLSRISCSSTFVNNFFSFHIFLKMSTLNSTFFHVFIVLPFCTIRSLFYCIFSLLGNAIVRLPLLPASHAPYFRSYASCFTSSSNSSPAE